MRDARATPEGRLDNAFFASLQAVREALPVHAARYVRVHQANGATLRLDLDGQRQPPELGDQRVALVRRSLQPPLDAHAHVVAQRFDHDGIRRAILVALEPEILVIAAHGVHP